MSAPDVKSSGLVMPEGGWRDGDQVAAEHDGALLVWVRRGQRWSPTPSAKIDVPDDVLARWVQDGHIVYVHAPREAAHTATPAALARNDEDVREGIARALSEQALDRFRQYGSSDARGAAFWDTATAIRETDFGR